MFRWAKNFMILKISLPITSHVQVIYHYTCEFLSPYLYVALRSQPHSWDYKNYRRRNKLSSSKELPSSSKVFKNHIFYMAPQNFFLKHGPFKKKTSESSNDHHWFRTTSHHSEIPFKLDGWELGSSCGFLHCPKCILLGSDWKQCDVGLRHHSLIQPKKDSSG